VGFTWCFVKRQALKMLFSRSGLEAHRVLAFGDIRHVAGVGAKNRTNPC
jgi:low affinity ammonium uptake protein